MHYNHSKSPGVILHISSLIGEFSQEHHCHCHCHLYFLDISSLKSFLISLLLKEYFWNDLCFSSPSIGPIQRWREAFLSWDEREASLSWDKRWEEHHRARFVNTFRCARMVVGEFLYLATKSLKSRRLDLLSNHEICFQNFSFSSRNWRKLQISRFFLAKILVLFSNQKTYLNISKFEIWIPYFPFSSWFHFLASPQCLTHGKIPETCYTLVSFLLHELLEYLPPLPPRALKRSKPPLFSSSR